MCKSFVLFTGWTFLQFRKQSYCSEAVRWRISQIFEKLIFRLFWLLSRFGFVWLGVIGLRGLRRRWFGFRVVATPLVATAASHVAASTRKRIDTMQNMCPAMRLCVHASAHCRRVTGVDASVHWCVGALMHGGSHIHGPPSSCLVGGLPPPDHWGMEKRHMGSIWY